MAQPAQLLRAATICKQRACCVPGILFVKILGRALFVNTCTRCENFISGLSQTIKELVSEGISLVLLESDLQKCALLVLCTHLAQRSFVRSNFLDQISHFLSDYRDGVPSLGDLQEEIGDSPENLEVPISGQSKS